MTDGNLPKAILYSWPTSVWSTVPRLCLYEKGYSEDEYVVRYVDITKGENFAPSYLKINMNGTIPTLVVPTIETTGSGVDTRYRSLRDTVTICDFLDHARSSSSASLHTDKPAPTLAPATIEGKALSDAIVAIIHQTTVDPNFVALSARDKKELANKAADGPGRSLSLRREALRRYLEEAKQAATENTVAPKDGGLTYEQKIVNFIEDKLQSNEHIWSLYNGQAGEENEKAFFDISTQTWTEALPDAFSKLETAIRGPYALGDQVSLADLHAISWLTRLVSIAGGEADATGLDTLEPYVGKGTLGPKLRKFWDVWVERESYKKVLVPATAAFAHMR
ncbi:hypothetical protein IAR55_005013 [Kwoniella newhampshirensis]|uniref:GST N-terminal domain-containing protein n=1 Tax=Kwoniella newhampshirensis TaxID=1651941 RepID=A0AAW0YWH1_9TREE